MSFLSCLLSTPVFSLWCKQKKRKRGKKANTKNGKTLVDDEDFADDNDDNEEVVVPSAADDDVEDEEEPKNAIEPKNVIGTSDDILYLGFYRKDNGKQIRSMGELDEQIALNKEDPTKGCPEELVWVSFRDPENSDTHQFEPWTEFVIAEQWDLLKKWMYTRKNYRLSVKVTAPEMEDVAASVLGKLWEDIGNNPIECAKALQDKWAKNGLI